MRVSVIQKSPRDSKSGLLAMFLTEEDVGKLKKKKPAGGLDGLVHEMIVSGDFKGKLSKASFTYTHGSAKSKRLLLIGLGKSKGLTHEKIRRATSTAVQVAMGKKLPEVSAVFPKLKFKDQEIAQWMTEGAILSHYKFDKYKEKSRKKRLKTKDFYILYPGPLSRIKDSIKKAQLICENVNFVRDLQTDLTKTKTPEKLARLSQQIARKNRLKITIFNRAQLQRMGMNLLLAVSQGSQYEPRLVILEYNGDKKSKKKTALVGKGIVFDTGGLNLKPTNYIEDMNLDMSGAAVVLGTIKTLAELKAKVNVIAIMPLCENMIGPKAVKPRDIVKSYSGLTVEIGNTDAEGRLILADALAYTEKKYKPEQIIDLATLTGAVLVTFDTYVAALMYNNEQFANKIFEAGEKTYERVWKLPLYEEYKEKMKSKFADLGNISSGRYAGTITAGAFLENFVKKSKWAHLDIAGTAWYEKSADHIPERGTGWGVRLLTELLTCK